MAKKNTFEPRARLMLLLGDQLIRDAGVAVFELVKNAYDADATKCEVILKNIDTDHGMIVVEDDGEGMSLRTVRTVWLRPGTRNRMSQREKKDEEKRRSKKFKRLPLGEKGVGRFAVHKLGQQVTLVTRRAGFREVVVEIDWNDFDSNKPLSQIPIKVKSRVAEVFKGDKSGTRIVVRELRDRPWTRRRVRSLHRSVTSICSPVETNESFGVEMKISPDIGWLDGLLTSDEVLDQALFKFDGTIDDDCLTYDYSFVPTSRMKLVSKRSIKKKVVLFPKPTRKKSEKEDAEEDKKIDLTEFEIGPIHFEFYVFDRDKQTTALIPSWSRTLKNFLDQNGGVRVYRDGVRIYDFGEPGNDWLELGSRRINQPSKKIGNNQIIGIVQVNLDQSKDLVEKTNREGFVENDASEMFRRAIQFAIKQAELERNQDKKEIRDAYSHPKNKEPVLGELNILRDEVKSLPIVAARKKEISALIDRIDAQYREVLDRWLTAAGAGLNLSLVLHETEKEIKWLYDDIKQHKSVDRIASRAKDLSELVDGVAWLTRQSGKSVVSASEMINQLSFVWKFRFERHEVKLVNGITLGDPDFKIRCNRRLILTALMNAIDNAIFWVSSQAKREIYLGTSFEYDGKPAIVVADNGPGFQDPSEYLTEAFVTRKLGGMGLGLHLAKEVMEKQKGQLVFPKSGDVTLPKQFTGATLLFEFEKQV